MMNSHPSRSETAAASTADDSLSSLLSFLRPPLVSPPSNPAFTTGAEADGLTRMTQTPATESIYRTGDPNHMSTVVPYVPTSPSTISSSIAACGNAGTSKCPPTSSLAYRKPINFAPNSSLSINTTTEPCTPLAGDKAVTEYSIVYTSTITFYGNSSDYTPPYSPITTPNYCSPLGEALITFFSTSHIANSTSEPTAPAPSSASPSYDLIIPAPAPTFSIDLPEIITQTPDAAGLDDGGIIITIRPFFSFTRRVVTFITTDKNPSVVISSDVTPAFDQTLGTGDLADGDHKTVQIMDNPHTKARTSNPLQIIKQPPASTFQLTAGGDQVIINDKTVSGLQPGQTTTIRVGNEVFTILPTAVVGLGSTITKSAPQGPSPTAPAATSGIFGGVQVVILGTQVVVDGATLSIIPAQKATTMINGRTVVVGTGAIAVGSETLVFQDPSPRPTHEIVTGGEMLTAIGNSVVILDSITITYGPSIAPDKITINGETVSIGPRGVSLHGSTIGGPSVNATDTEFEIVGGITVGTLLPSLVVVNGATYSINQDGDPNNVETTVIEGQTITIGASGLVMSSQTLAYPDTSVTATLSPSGAPMSDFPAETGRHGGYEDGDDDDSGASSTRLGLHIGGIMYICMAMCVWLLT